LEDIVSKIDSDGNGSVEYSEFLTHALGRKQLSETNLKSFFMIMQPKDTNKPNGLEIIQENQEESSSSDGSENPEDNFQHLEQNAENPEPEI